MIGDPRMFTSLDKEVDGQERIIFGGTQRAKFKDWAKWQYQMIIQFQIAICHFIEFQLAIRWSIV